MSPLEILLLSGIISPIAVLILCVVWGVMSYLTPKPSKMLTRASIRHQTLLFMFMGNRVIEVLRCLVHPEGYLETLEKKAKHHYIPIARPIYRAPTEGQTDEEKRESAKLNEELETLERSTLGVSSFAGCRVPVYIGFAGVGLATNVETVLGLSSKNEIQGYEVPKLEETEQRIQEKGKDIIKKAIGVTGYVVIKVLLPVNPESIKKHLSLLVDTSTLDGIRQDGYEEGYHTARQAKNEKLILYMGLAMLIIGGIVTALNIIMK